MKISRKLAIKNLKGADELARVNWMLENMKKNKTYSYLTESFLLKKKRVKY